MFHLEHFPPIWDQNVRPFIAPTFHVEHSPAFGDRYST